MKIEEVLASRHIMCAFLGLIAGVLSLIILESGDDFIPAVLLSILCFSAGVLVLTRLKKMFAVGSLPFFLLTVFTLMYSLDGFYEDLAEPVIGFCAAVGFIAATVSIFLLLLSFQKEEKSS